MTDANCLLILVPHTSSVAHPKHWKFLHPNMVLVCSLVVLPEEIQHELVIL